MKIARFRELDTNGGAPVVSISRNGKFIILRQGSQSIRIHASKIQYMRKLLEFTQSENVDWAMFDMHNKWDGGHVPLTTKLLNDITKSI